MRPASRRFRHRRSTSTRSPPRASISAARSVPAWRTSLSALIERAARITRIDLEEPREAIGRSTRAAIHSGFIFGFAGLIDGIVGRIEEELPKPQVLATGGYASVVVPFTETIDEVDDMLTLKGLRLIHERNTRTAPAD